MVFSNGFAGGPGSFVLAIGIVEVIRGGPNPVVRAFRGSLSCGMRTAEQDAARKNLQNLMEKRLGQTMNASSPLTLADVEDKLQRGMLIEEFDRVVADRNQGPNNSTKVVSHALIEGDQPKANPKKGIRTYYLQDADLIVVSEFVGADDKPQEQVVSWRTEPLKKD